jgi:hypothetical protein
MTGRHDTLGWALAFAMHRRRHLRRNRGLEPSRFLSAQYITEQENDHGDS